MLKASQLIAHRGLQADYPENSLLAFEKAISAGAKHIECDVQLSADGIFVLCHDRHLLRMSNVDKFINEMPSEEIFKTPAHEPSRLGEAFDHICFTKLESFIALAQKHPGIHFYIELKRGALVSHGIAYCLDTLSQQIAGMNNCTVISFDQQAIKEASSRGIKRAGIVLEHWHHKDDIIAYCQASVAYINKDHIPADASISAACPIAVYEVSNIDEAKALLQRGASLIETFLIDRLIGH